jgi:hypothetical protein
MKAARIPPSSNCARRSSSSRNPPRPDPSLTGRGRPRWTESNELAVIADDFVISSRWACRFARTFIATLDPKRATYYFLIGDIVEGRIARPANYSFAYWDLVAGGPLNPPSEKRDGISIEERFRRADPSRQEVDELAITTTAIRQSADASANTFATSTRVIERTQELAQRRCSARPQ